MTDTAKFKFNYKTGEIEIEGSEAFVKEQVGGIEEQLELFANSSINSRDGDAIQEDEELGELNDSKAGDAGAPPGTFGEWMHSFKSTLNDLDKALITACFVQTQSSSNDFKTSDVNNALKDHGIKLSNPSQSLKSLSTKKHLFQTRKVGKLRFMRVSADGQEHLATLKREG